jgi:hypothetical protein
MYCLVCTFAAGCVFENRLTVENALKRIRQIRSAEQDYRRSHGRYGSIDDLYQTRLIPEELGDGVDMGYTFELFADVSQYSLDARPIRDTGSSFYMDETGVIRASYTSNAPANKSSEAIKNQ